ncbi:hypothetical protein CONPUDRAFT_76942 [Coniophora puteana RWD-64-598 SS2]|uniref:Uncharacterized protein n=1 Tax=Coniophora puteana (strain RWD-64-598) TaxID=741705 RepID=A0A5M3M9D0_CONPW|nr:uncharacterized protein CONPUDRAFT_76942 [Coniophora puteana RWD-64-598 SS2]EIW75892.1 hypothetical protein CONPUDRAFT_76942 [Coniophora puteana RWD-64-598 SS2]
MNLDFDQESFIQRPTVPTKRRDRSSAGANDNIKTELKDSGAVNSNIKRVRAFAQHWSLTKGHLNEVDEENALLSDNVQDATARDRFNAVTSAFRRMRIHLTRPREESPADEEERESYHMQNLSHHEPPPTVEVYPARDDPVRHT